jgi:hypothetical protein
VVNYFQNIIVVQRNSIAARYANMKRTPATGGKSANGGMTQDWKQFKNSFENFIADMGRKPSPELSLGRIDSDGNYEPGNCKWAIVEEQAMNREAGRRQRRIAKLWG